MEGRLRIAFGDLRFRVVGYRISGCKASIVFKRSDLLVWSTIPAQQASETECMEACDNDDNGEPSWDTDKEIGQVVCWMDSIDAVFPAMISP